MIYDTPHFRLLRKPAGIPSSRWQEYSFLDGIRDSLVSGMYTSSAGKPLAESFELFGPDHEYGLLNRLDNKTCGLLYFAKNKDAATRYLKLQAAHKITKYYIATVYGQMRWAFWRVNTPLAHHPTDANRMVALESEDDDHRSQIIDCETYREKFYYDVDLDMTTLLVQITKWARHQIRCHLWSLGHPIANDDLYTTKKQRHKWKKQWRYNDNDELGLMSVGLRYP